MNTIGRKDKLDLPEFGLENIEAKIDTGAYGCALHCHKVMEVSKGVERVLSFELLDPSHPEYENITYKAHSYRTKTVKSSTGVAEHRYVIETQVILFGKTQLVEFSLTDRGKMKYPILLGRKFLNKKYIVDVALKNLSFKLKSNPK